MTSIPESEYKDDTNSSRLSRLRIEKRSQVSRWGQIQATIIAIVGAVFVCALLIQMAGASVQEAFAALISGAVGSPRAIFETLVKATPLILTSQAATLAFRGKVWNIGIEGQFFSGAMAAYWAYTLFEGLPPVPLFFVVLLGGFVGGGVSAAIAGILKVKFDVDEIISTVMLNFIVIYFLSLLLSGVGPWREDGSFYQQSAPIGEVAKWLILIPKSRLHIGFIVAIIVTLLVYVLLEKSVLGYKIRALGFNPKAVRFRGISTAKTFMLVMLISGGIAGLGGASELFGVQHRLRPDLSPGYGYTGMIIAFLGGLNPIAVGLLAIFFGGLVNGSVRMQVITGVPSALVFALQAIILLFLLGAKAIAHYRIRRV